jgi:hypothetical protein
LADATYIPIEAGMSVVQTLKSAPPAGFAGRKVENLGTLDGSKVFLERGQLDSLPPVRDRAALLRVYCEASKAEVE